MKYYIAGITVTVILRYKLAKKLNQLMIVYNYLC
jgi:hypothetical protein